MGTWVLVEEDRRVYVHIVDTRLTTYVEAVRDTCYRRTGYDLEHVEGDRYTASNSDGPTTLVIRRDGGNLEIGQPREEPPHDLDLMQPADTDVVDLYVCTGGGIADLWQGCTALPEVTVGSSVTGALEVTDSQGISVPRS